MKKNLRSKLKKQAGFSLVEILLVVVIVGFMVLIVYNIPSSLRLNGDSSKTSLVKEIASKSIEDTRLSGYANLANGTNNISDSRLSTLTSSTGTVTISNCPGTICTHSEALKQVTVQINWTEEGKAKSYQITTFVSTGGLD